MEANPMSETRPARSSLWAPIVLTLAVAIAVVVPTMRRSTPAVYNAVDEGSYLDQLCAQYSASLEKARQEIRREINDSVRDRMDGLFDQEHAASASGMIEAVRLCGGRTVDDLHLRVDDLVSIGMMKPIAPKGEEP